MRNAVPDSIAQRSAERALRSRVDTYVDEVLTFVDAAKAIMARTGDVDPRVAEVVREAQLSNQAFYRHFRSKDELLLAVLAEGQADLVHYLEARLDSAEGPADQVRRWIEGILNQAANPRAATATRPFAVNGNRLADLFPEEAARTAELLKAPLVGALQALPSRDPRRDADAIYHLTLGRMHAHLVERTRPTKRDVEHIVAFALGGARGA